MSGSYELQSAIALVSKVVVQAYDAGVKDVEERVCKQLDLSPSETLEEGLARILAAAKREADAYNQGVQDLIDTVRRSLGFAHDDGFHAARDGGHCKPDELRSHDEAASLLEAYRTNS